MHQQSALTKPSACKVLELAIQLVVEILDESANLKNELSIAEFLERRALRIRTSLEKDPDQIVIL